MTGPGWQPDCPGVAVTREIVTIAGVGHDLMIAQIPAPRAHFSVLLVGLPAGQKRGSAHAGALVVLHRGEWTLVSPGLTRSDSAPVLGLAGLAIVILLCTW